ncbi:conserved membrane hypothetical protein [Candidatus Terasakiella magnetica]|nr:conserved membrane hypothetical protein [Candidatus Terasakiella magnetica]
MTGALGVWLATGLLSALLFLSLAEGFSAGVLLSYLAPLPLMMVGLSRKTMATMVAGLAAMAAVAAVGGGKSSLAFSVAVVLPSLVVVRQSLLCRQSGDSDVEWYPPGLVLGHLTGIAVALILIGAALVAGTASEGETGGVQGWVAEIIGRTMDVLASTLTVEQRRRAVDWWVPFFPAMVAGSWLMMAVVNATSAQGLLRRTGKNRRPTPIYREMELPGWLGTVLVVALATGLMVEGDLGYLARSVAAVTAVPFCLLGLAAIHRWAQGRPNARFILAGLYGVLFLASVWALVPITGLGLVRFVTRFRRGPNGDGGKEE